MTLLTAIHLHCSQGLSPSQRTSPSRGHSSYSKRHLWGLLHSLSRYWSYYSAAAPYYLTAPWSDALPLETAPIFIGSSVCAFVCIGFGLYRWRKHCCSCWRQFRPEQLRLTVYLGSTHPQVASLMTLNILVSAEGIIIIFRLLIVESWVNSYCRGHLPLGLDGWPAHVKSELDSYMRASGRVDVACLPPAAIGLSWFASLAPSPRFGLYGQDSSQKASATHLLNLNCQEVSFAAGPISGCSGRESAWQHILASRLSIPHVQYLRRHSGRKLPELLACRPAPGVIALAAVALLASPGSLGCPDLLDCLGSAAETGPPAPHQRTSHQDDSDYWTLHARPAQPPLGYLLLENLLELFHCKRGLLFLFLLVLEECSTPPSPKSFILGAVAAL